MTKQAKAYQFKITLKGIRPPVWRRIVVPDTYTFWDLHCAIQDAMGWSDSHLHEFRVYDPKTDDEVLIGIPDEDGFDDIDTEPGWKLKLKKFLYEGAKISYVYDFGDNWEHTVVLEKIVPSPAPLLRPICLDGMRNCPPEDCGGIPGYAELLKTIRNPRHEDYKSMMEWLGGGFDPEAFNPADVQFEDPKKRLKHVL